MAKDWSVRRLLDVLSVSLATAASLGLAGICIAISAGAFEKPDQLSDIQNVLRVLAGAVGAFVLAAAIELVSARRRQNVIRDELSSLGETLSLATTFIHPVADGILKRRDDLAPWTQTVQGCQDLRMSGLSLRTFTAEHLASVRRMLERGGKCRFLLLKPASDASRITALNFLGQEDSSQYDAQINASLRRLATLRAEFPDRLKIRTLEHIPAASITILKNYDTEPAAYIEFYTEDESSVGRPHLQLSPSNSPVWYQYFADQFEILWGRADDYATGVPS